MGLFQCRHDKFGPLKPDGMQYCLSCNRAFKVGRPKCSHSAMSAVGADGNQTCKDCGMAFKPSSPAPVQKSHVLEVASEDTILASGSSRQDVVTQRCTRCGKMFGYNKTCSRYSEENPSSSRCDE